MFVQELYPKSLVKPVVVGTLKVPFAFPVEESETLYVVESL